MAEEFAAGYENVESTKRSHIDAASTAAAE
jgi:hypothetical protein